MGDPNALSETGEEKKVSTGGRGTEGSNEPKKSKSWPWPTEMPDDAKVGDDDDQEDESKFRIKTILKMGNRAAEEYDIIVHNPAYRTLTLCTPLTFGMRVYMMYLVYLTHCEECEAKHLQRFALFFTGINLLFLTYSLA